MPTFTPPTVDAVPPVPDRPEDAPSRLSWRLFRHFRARPEGRNVYIIDGVATEADPQTTYNDDGTIDEFARDRITRFFQAGGTYTVTAAEQTILEAGGFTVDA